MNLLAEEETSNKRRTTVLSDNAGFALASVLWFVLLLALLAASVSSVANTEQMLTTKHLDILNDRAAAQAGLAIAVSRLTDETLGRSFGIASFDESLLYNNRLIKVSIKDEHGKIDLNAADESLLNSLFLAAGLNHEEANVFKDRLLDWRDQNEFAHLNGAEASEYSSRGWHHTPRNSPFETMDEMSQVLGVNEALLACLAPSITVYSGRKTANVLPATDLTRRALQSLEQQIHRNDAGPTGNTRRSAVGRVFAISVEVGLARATSIIKVTGDKETPYWLLSARPFIHSEQCLKTNNHKSP